MKAVDQNVTKLVEKIISIATDAQIALDEDYNENKQSDYRRLIDKLSDTIVRVNRKQ